MLIYGIAALPFGLMELFFNGPWDIIFSKDDGRGLQKDFNLFHAPNVIRYKTCQVQPQEPSTDRFLSRF